MLLTGTEIGRERRRGVITIDPFDPECVEPNSYGFHLGASLITYPEDVLDPFRAPATETRTMGPGGAVPHSEWHTSGYLHTRNQLVAFVRAGAIALILLGILALIVWI